MTPSMRADNFYSFVCPMTRKLERYLHCILRRHKHWRGEKVEPTCATCMNAGKCPALKMIDRELREEKAIYTDPTPGRARKVPEDIIKLIENKIIWASHAFGTGIERARLEELMGQKVRDVVFQGIQDAVIVPEEQHTMGPLGVADGITSKEWGERRSGKPRELSKPRRAATPAPAAETDLVAALGEASTDMASAINQAISSAGEGA